MNDLSLQERRPLSRMSQRSDNPLFLARLDFRKNVNGVRARAKRIIDHRVQLFTS
jgi:hypothetical protein